MTIYLIPAVIAFLISVIVFFAAIQGRSRSTTFCVMTFSFICLSVCQILGHFEQFSSSTVLLLMRIYYVVLIISLTSIWAYTTSIMRYTPKHSKYCVLALAFLLCVLIVFTDLVVMGVENLAYTQTAIKGILYPGFQLFALVILGLTIAALVKGYLRPKDHLMQIQCSYTLLAISPLILSCIVLIVIMALGYKINGALIMPIFQVAFTLITLLGESKHQITDVRRFMPYSPERYAANEIMEVFSSFARDEISYRDGVSEIERLLVLHKYEANDRNASATAQLMKMPRSSLYSVFNRLGIDPEKGSKNQVNSGSRVNVE